MYPFISKVEEILEQHNIHFSELLESKHITINTEEMMVDPGFAYDNKVLDLFIDEANRILFIGLLRLPKNSRNNNIGSQIVQEITDWANQNGYTLFLDSCGDSCFFWSKCGFSTIERKYGFDIMGFSPDINVLKEKWKCGKKLFMELHH